MLRSRWRGLETESRLGLHGHERGNPGHRQGHDLTDHRASPRPYQPGRPPIPDETRQLIVRMETENPWRARKIQAELAKLGIRVSLATISRYLPTAEPAGFR